jgi:hypothetical protein
MNSETTTIQRQSDSPTIESSEIRIFGQRASIRALIVLILVVTVSVMSMIGHEVKEPLYTLVGSAVGFYFGQDKKK